VSERERGGEREQVCERPPNCWFISGKAAVMDFRYVYCAKNAQSEGAC
jgi:hypothetical protein